jgi:formylglycine-generating enzyme required for sulfatase activity
METSLNVKWSDLAPEQEDELARRGGWKAGSADAQVALAYLALGRKDGAAVAKALRAAGEHPVANHLRARLAAGRDAAAYDRGMTRARSAVRGKRWKAAVAALKDALAGKPGDPEATRLLAEARSMLPPDPALTLELGGGVEMELVYIKPGVFVMGSDEDPRLSWQGVEKPKHEVAITQGFYIGKYEVTQEQFEAVTGGNPSKWKEPSGPVEHVTWHQAAEFCRLATGRTGRQLRLPTEAEWEYTCRAGSTGRYFFGDDKTRMEKHAWYNNNSDMQTHPVGRKEPNAWSLCDMYGNVSEWVADWYDADYYSNSPRQNPTGPDSGRRRIVRGGGMGDYCYRGWSTLRRPLGPSGQGPDRGFRVAASASPQGR